MTKDREPYQRRRRAGHGHDAPAGSGASAAARLHAAALLILLAVAAVRPTISEEWFPPDRWSMPESDDPDSAVLAWPTPSTTTGLTALVGLAGVLWLVGAAVGGGLAWRSVPGLLGIASCVVGTILSLPPSTTDGPTATAVSGAIHRGSAIHAATLWLGELAMFVLLVQLIGRYRDLSWTVAALLASLGLTAAKGLHQHFVEMPSTRFYYESMRQGERLIDALSRRGTGEPLESIRQTEAPDDEQRRQWFEDRLTKGALTGYVSHTNLYAGLLMIGMLIAVGLALDRRRAGPTGRVSTIAAVGAAALLAGTMLLANSRGATVAGAVGAAALLAVVRFGDVLIARRRLVAIALILLAVGSVAGVIAYGNATGGLADRNLTFRWQYWTATADMIGEHWLRGVGPANFGARYPFYMPDAGIEEVQNPHNIVLHAFAEFGVFGAVGLLLWFGLTAWRLYRTAGIAAAPADEPAAEAAPTPAWVPGAILSAALVVLWAWIGVSEALLFIALIVLPAGIWFGLFTGLNAGADSADRPMPYTTAALGCAAAAALLHGLIDINLFTPSGGTIILTAAAAFVAGRNLRTASGGGVDAAPPAAGEVRPAPVGSRTSAPPALPAGACAVLGAVAFGLLIWYWVAVHRPRADADGLVAQARDDMAQSRLNANDKLLVAAYVKLERASKADPHSTAALEGMIDFHIRRYRRALQEEHDLAAGRRTQPGIRTDMLQARYRQLAGQELAYLQSRIVEFGRRRPLDPAPYLTLAQLHRTLAEAEGERAAAAMADRTHDDIAPFTMMFEPMVRLLDAGIHLRWAAVAAEDAVRRRPRDPVSRLGYARALESLQTPAAVERALAEYYKAKELNDARAKFGGGFAPRQAEALEGIIRRLETRGK